MNSMNTIIGKVIPQEIFIEKEQGKNSHCKAIKKLIIDVNGEHQSLDFDCTRKQYKAILHCIENQKEVRLSIQSSQHCVTSKELKLLEFMENVRISNEDCFDTLLGKLKPLFSN